MNNETITFYFKYLEKRWQVTVPNGPLAFDGALDILHERYEFNPMHLHVYGQRIKRI